MIPGNKISDFKLKYREFHILRRGLLRVKNFSVGTVRSNDADGDENVKKKKTIGFITKTTTSHVHHAFLYISLPFMKNYDVKMPNFTFYGVRKQATTKFYFSL